MNDLLLVAIAIIIAIIIIGIIMRFVRIVLKVLGIIIIVAICLIAISGFFIVADVKEFKDQMRTEPLRWFLSEDGMLTAGMETVNFNEAQTTYFNSSELQSLSQSYSSMDYEALRHDSFKVVITDIELFRKQEESRIDNTERETELITNKDLIRILASQDPLVEQEQTVKLSRTLSIASTASKVKKSAFMLLVFNTVKNKGPFFIIDGFKKEQIIVYPGAKTFSFSKKIPAGLWKNTFGSLYPDRKDTEKEVNQDGTDGQADILEEE